MFAVAEKSGAVAVFPSGAEFNVEIAADPETRRRGYMYRDAVGVSGGMLFVFETTGRYGFWMKNCKVALDIIWLDEDFQVVEIAHDQQPCPPEGQCSTYQPLRVARYVLEVAAGTARREGLRGGDRIVVLPEPGQP